MNISIVRLGPVTAQLKRIADALEAIVANQYGQHITPPLADTSGDEPAVFYSSDEHTADLEMREALQKAGITIPGDQPEEE